MANFATSEQLKNNYDDYYTDGDSKWRRLGALDKSNNIVRLCRKLPHRTILEIGAGEGSILKRLSEIKFGEELSALEISETGVETIKNRNIPRVVDCQLFDGYDIPYEDKKFDLAILSHVVEHVEYPRKLIYEAMRVSRSLFIEVPLENTIRMKPDFVFDKVGHINFYSPQTFRRLVQTCNLKVLKQINTNHSPQIYWHRKKIKGILDYFIKQIALKTTPGVAPKIFVYHSSIVCQDASEQTAAPSPK